MRLMESHDINLIFLGGRALGRLIEPHDINLSKLNVKITISHNLTVRHLKLWVQEYLLLKLETL